VTRAVVVRPAAANDIGDAFDWYEAQRAGLGRQFLDEIEACLGRIAARPEAFPVAMRDARRALVRRFPYSVYFRASDHEVRVLAVIHQSRDPRVWRGRVR
jgi:plasmid stabilization system protein ParE